ncbi:four-carbon acid sugar kinase family protein [Billgrantia kenyensis]|uniref:Four-carbon acid sugar kinase family protein n=1 Tax=Billgrantia kenyensis TaxID=321266 RepID=A0A7V9W2I6_9GAMM|nr:four-carbon acid sugar kinase family protein [Halomonas kenyensis]MBA2779849.1 four-carbon acid sugar kinase family protein [Halomonas kenyensis]MCG6662250.1 four-carbon acid sugar kinase family protein [Halomonas kenyensis]
MNGCRVAIVADDLTGALDAAAPFAARGAQTRVVIAPERLEAALSAWGAAPPEVIAVNTESRHLPAAEAAERVAAVTRRLVPHTPTVWFNKVDSTLRGQVVAESLAMRDVIPRRLLVAPAVPAQGRTVCEGRVWVAGEPLDGSLDRVFAAAGVPLVRHARPCDAPLPEGDCVADTGSDRELACLYDAVLQAPDRWLLVGAAGLATAVAQRCFGLLRAAPCRLTGVERVLYALGSRAQRTLEQERRLQEHAPGLARVTALKGGDEEATAVLLTPGADDDTELAPSRVAAAMGEAAVGAVSHWPQASKGLLFLSGGDIAVATLSRLGATVITVEAEWAPGIALGRLEGAPQRLVMTKAGGFGDPDLLVQLHGRLGLEHAPTLPTP